MAASRSKTALINEYFKPKSAYRRGNVAAYLCFALCIVMCGLGVVLVLQSGKGLFDGGFASTGPLGGILFGGGFMLSILGVIFLLRTVSYDSRARVFFEERMNERFSDMRAYDTSGGSFGVQDPNDDPDAEPLVDTAEEADSAIQADEGIVPEASSDEPAKERKGFLRDMDMRMDASDYEALALKDNGKLEHLAGLMAEAGLQVAPQDVPAVFLSGSTFFEINGRASRYWVDDTEFFHSTNFEGTLLLFAEDALYVVQRRDALDTKTADNWNAELVEVIGYDSLESFSVMNLWFKTGVVTSKLKLQGDSLSYSKYRALCIRYDGRALLASLAYRGLSAKETDRYYIKQLELIREQCALRAPQCDTVGLDDGRYGYRPAQCAFFDQGTLVSVGDEKAVLSAIKLALEG